MSQERAVNSAGLCLHLKTKITSVNQGAKAHIKSIRQT